MLDVVRPAYSVPPRAARSPTEKEPGSPDVTFVKETPWSTLRHIVTLAAATIAPPDTWKRRTLAKSVIPVPPGPKLAPPSVLR